MARVELRNVTKEYAGNEVIHGISLDVADGEFKIGRAWCRERV